PNLGEILGQACTGLESHPADVDSGPPRHLILATQVFLANSSQGIPAHALYVVPQCPVEPSLLVETINGWVLSSGSIKAAIQPLCLTISSHEEAIQFYITSGLHFPVVLGLVPLSESNAAIVCGGSDVVVYSALSIRLASEEARPSVPWSVPCTDDDQPGLLVPDFASLTT
ncbi:Retrotransposon-derived protein PEG10, partial [Ophiophagus hannah]